MEVLFGFNQLARLNRLTKYADLVYKAQIHRAISPHSPSFAKSYPLASLFVFALCEMIPDIFLSLALGRPFIERVGDSTRFLLVFLFWYATFFSPNDLFHRLFQWKLAKAALLTLVEMNRALNIRNVYHLVTANHFWSFSAVLMVCSLHCSMFSIALFPLDQLIRGSNVVVHEAKDPSLGTRLNVLYCLLFGMAHRSGLLSPSGLGGAGAVLPEVAALRLLFLLGCFMQQSRLFLGRDLLTSVSSAAMKLMSYQLTLNLPAAAQSVTARGRPRTPKSTDSELTPGSSPKKILAVQRRRSSRSHA